ncbi:MAG: hypothetical protein GX442_00900 [Candidatus Riflebacteria bacterium]|nr:hypothetical protein [Candidatus Riflebacteria bacterium]
MGDPFWDPIFDRLKDDLDLLRLMAFDLDDGVLVDLLRPNSPLQRRLAPFVKGRRLVRRGPFIVGLLQDAGHDEPLRRILFFSWITANGKTMTFPSVPADAAALERLRAGEFGPPTKVAILARIDPRPAARLLLEGYLAEVAAAAGSGGHPPSPAAVRPPAGPPSARQPPTAPPSADRPPSGPPSAGQTSPVRPAAAPPSAGQPLAVPPLADQPPSAPLSADQPPTAPPAADQPSSAPPAAGQPPADKPAAAGPGREAELKRRLDEAREEARNLRRQLKAAEAERQSLQGRASAQGGELARLRQELEGLRQELERTRARHAALAAERASGPAGGRPAGAEPPPPDGAVPGSPGPGRPEDRARITTLEEALARRAATISRLEGDLEEARRRLERSADQAGQVARLQELSHRQEAELEAGRQAVPGRVVTRAQEAVAGRSGAGPGGRRVVVVEIADARLVQIPENRFRPGPPVDGEWVLLHPGPDGTWSGGQLLETAARLERVGVLACRGGSWFLDGDEESWPVWTALTAADEGVAAAGVWLPALAERPAGIHGVRVLATAAVAAPPTFTSFATIQRFFRLIAFDAGLFARFLADQGIPATVRPDGIDWGKDARGALNALRGRLPVRVACERPECRRTAAAPAAASGQAPAAGPAAASDPVSGSAPAAASDQIPAVPGSGEAIRSWAGGCFLRDPGEDEVCSVCHEIAGTAEPVAASWDFGGARVVIVGGDVVGSRYAESLARHRLQVDWHGGFAGLGGVRDGLGGAAALVIILAQISHTLLRELLPVARAAGVPVVFCPVRGVTGVLRRLVEFLQPGQGKP